MLLSSNICCERFRKLISKSLSRANKWLRSPPGRRAMSTSTSPGWLGRPTRKPMRHHMPARWYSSRSTWVVHIAFRASLKLLELERLFISDAESHRFRQSLPCHRAFQISPAPPSPRRLTTPCRGHFRFYQFRVFNSACRVSAAPLAKAHRDLLQAPWQWPDERAWPHCPRWKTTAVAE